MKTLTINFQRVPKKKSRSLWAGLILLSGAVAIFVLGNLSEFWHYWHLTNLFILSIALVMLGKGIHPLSFFGKAHFVINEGGIAYKPSSFKSGMKVTWENIDQISVKIRRIVVTTTNMEPLIIEYDKFEHSEIHPLKSTLLEICQEKSILITTKNAA